MTEDILEQLVDNYFKRRAGSFSKHNVKYRPDISGLSTEEKRKFSVHSDIDVLSVNLKKKDVYAISCKSWQDGFDCKEYHGILSSKEEMNHVKYGRQRWKSFREITHPTWAKAFRDKIYEETGLKKFAYVIAVTKVKNESHLEAFCNEPKFLSLLSNDGEFNVKIEILSLEKMVTSIWEEDAKKTIESSEIGRFIQLLKAAGIVISGNSSTS